MILNIQLNSHWVNIFGLCSEVLALLPAALTPKPDRSQFYLKHPHEVVREIIIGMRCKGDTRLALLRLRNERYPHAAIYETAADASTFEIERKLLV